MQTTKINKPLFYKEVNPQVENEMNHVTYNCVPLGHLGANLYLAMFHVVEEHGNLYQHAYTKEVQLLCVMVKTKQVSNKKKICWHSVVTSHTNETISLYYSKSINSKFNNLNVYLLTRSNPILFYLLFFTQCFINKSIKK